jgi:AraC family transcriptional regulator
MAGLASILSAIDYIEGHLHEPTTVGEVAQATGYSLHYFCRAFNQATHHAPYDYMMRRRLSEAAQNLVRGGGRIIDTALDHGFNGPEVFARAFKRMFGLQPRQVQAQGWLDRRLLMPRLSLAHLEMRGLEGVRPTVEEWPRISVAGFAGLVTGDRPGLARLWSILDEELEGLRRPRGGWRYIGIRSFPRALAEAGCAYMAAVEGRPDLASGTALVTKSLPAGRYARLGRVESAEAMRLSLDYAYGTWLPKAGAQLARPWELEEREGGKGRDGRTRAVLVPVV